MKKKLLSVMVIVILYYTLAGIYFELILPYPVLKGSIVLSESNQEYIIEYNDPDISYRDLLVEVSNKQGNSVEIIYIKCSDEARLIVSEGVKARFYHNFAGNIIIRSLNPLSETSCTFKVIDRVSFLVPKSASNACTNFSRLVFVMNVTVILFSLLLVIIPLYITLNKREQLKKYLKL